MSRRTRHAEPQQPSAAAAGFGFAAETTPPRIVSNPVFRCEGGPSSPPRKPPARATSVAACEGGDQLRCIYRPGSLYSTLVHDDDGGNAAGSDAIGKKPLPLPLPPCRAHPPPSSAAPVPLSSPRIRAPGRRAAPALDPFLAAYVACRMEAAAAADQAKEPPPQRRQRRRKKKKAVARQGEVVRGCGGGIWAAGARCAGAMSCRHGCAVASTATSRAVRAPAAASSTKAEAKQEEEGHAVPTLDLSWAPAVLSARALERRREQR